jgi:hypothetical protein
MWRCGEGVKIVYLDINPPPSTHVLPENRRKTVFNLSIGDLVLFKKQPSSRDRDECVSPALYGSFEGSDDIGVLSHTPGDWSCILIEGPAASYSLN